MTELFGETLAWLADPARWQWGDPAGVPYRTLEHLWVSLVAIVLAVAAAVPPALVLAHRRRAEALASAVVNLGRAIPSFGLIVLFWLLATRTGWVGTQFWPLVLALTALAMPPVFTNTYTAVRGVDPATVEAARGMGYTERQVLREVELPLASPVILAGVRIAFVQVIATTAIGAIVTNGGGLGRYVVDGFARGVSGRPIVLAGALLLAGLTLVADAAFTRLERLLVPDGVRDDAGLADVANRAGAAG
ncbi:ABC transporter permease [Egicoccus halophilus]|uniref:Glycine/betaine ABC transporter permease n=1 Tax=Egicoccus halophilus TaxID=1670830 RepID=A0A8J3A6U4_9ACTN|nr:ABC transporter permease subunit [Egicoccus halophilus]GGI04851.1 glycine/betaine ABC transporter permease [Egicoccus halophilus]